MKSLSRRTFFKLAGATPFAGGIAGTLKHLSDNSRLEKLKAISRYIYNADLKLVGERYYGWWITNAKRMFDGLIDVTTNQRGYRLQWMIDIGL